MYIYIYIYIYLYVYSSIVLVTKVTCSFAWTPTTCCFDRTPGSCSLMTLTAARRQRSSIRTRILAALNPDSHSCLWKNIENRSSIHIYIERDRERERERERLYIERETERREREEERYVYSYMYIYISVYMQKKECFYIVPLCFSPWAHVFCLNTHNMFLRSNTQNMFLGDADGAAAASVQCALHWATNCTALTANQKCTAQADARTLIKTSHQSKMSWDSTALASGDVSLSEAET